MYVIKNQQIMLTLKEFNALYTAYKREKCINIKLHHVKPFKLIKTVKQKIEKELKQDANGIPYYDRTVIKLEKPKVTFDVNQFNRLIVEYLKMYTNPIRASITNTAGKYIPNIGYVHNKADRGRSDITAQYSDFELCIETKQKYEKQLDSQKEFEAMTKNQSFRKYCICRDFESFQIEMKKIFKNLP